MKPLLLTVFLLFNFVLAKSQNEATQNLLNASLHGDWQGMKAAILSGADVNATDENGDTPLLMVTRLSYFKQTKFLVENGANVNVANKKNITPLHYAVEYNNVQMIKLLLDNQANTEAVDNINETPMHWACWTGNIKAAKLLIKYGANPHPINNTGIKPIDLAKRQEYYSLYNYLNKRRYYK